MKNASMQNVIILTSGLTGSSVLTGLLVRGGYWPGDRTAKKKDYDTYENADLVHLNLDLFQQADFTSNYQVTFSPDAVERITALAGRMDTEPFRSFARRCDAHQPWVWKDPRLWMTIRFWKQVTDLSSCKFLLLTRSHFQCWVSTNTRRIIQTYRHTKAYESAVEESTAAFVKENGFSHLRVTYENLIAKPEETIAELNGFLGTKLAVSDLSAVYRGELHKQPGASVSGVVKAALIYAKNYGERVDAR
jgi:hypothetical protein